ncbi:MAG: hypothetical protein LBF88_02005 [Planctomycetaceae bacterium]|jgi:glutamate synthase domain-containing protein 2|nr:hypothetical protein [Planctomycetaceae bacterium]
MSRVKRFLIGAMSFGALSREVHETMAMNQIRINNSICVAI